MNEENSAMTLQALHQCPAYVGPNGPPVTLAVSFHNYEGEPLPHGHWRESVMDLLTDCNLDHLDELHTQGLPAGLKLQETILTGDEDPTLIFTQVNLHPHRPKELAGRTEIMTGVATVRIADCSQDRNGRHNPEEPVIASTEFTVSAPHTPENREALPELMKLSPGHGNRYSAPSTFTATCYNRRACCCAGG